MIVMGKEHGLNLMAAIGAGSCEMIRALLIDAMNIMGGLK
jgi:hypothetical protein